MLEITISNLKKKAYYARRKSDIYEALHSYRQQVMKTVRRISHKNATNRKNTVRCRMQKLVSPGPQRVARGSEGGRFGGDSNDAAFVSCHLVD